MSKSTASPSPLDQRSADPVGAYLAEAVEQQRPVPGAVTFSWAAIMQTLDANGRIQYRAFSAPGTPDGYAIELIARAADVWRGECNE